MRNMFSLLYENIFQSVDGVDGIQSSSYFASAIRENSHKVVIIIMFILNVFEVCILVSEIS